MVDQPPVYDPSPQTIEAFQRELDSLHRELELRATVRVQGLDSLKEVLETRLDGIDRATELLSATINRTPTEITKEITHLKSILDERLRSVDARFVEADRLTVTQFSERDVRTEQASQSSSQALAAALQAAKELVGAQGEASAAAAVKAEVSTAKQIDQLVVIISTLEKSINDRITELKERIDRGEGTTTGARDTRVDNRAGTSLMVAILGTFLVVASIGVSIAALFR